MKKVIELTTPIKTFAAMLFAGFICLYIIGGILYAGFVDDSFTYSISFTHLLKGIGFTLIISLLWGLCFSDVVIKKWAFFKKQILFKLLLAVLLACCFFMFSIVETNWSALWLVVAGTMTVFVIVLSYLSEWYFRKTSKQYTELLKVHQTKIAVDVKMTP